MLFKDILLFIIEVTLVYNAVSDSGEQAHTTYNACHHAPPTARVPTLPYQRPSLLSPT